MTDVSKIIREAVKVTDPDKLRELGLDSKDSVRALIDKVNNKLAAESALAGAFRLDEAARRELTLLIKANPNNFDPVFKWIEEKGQSSYVDGYLTSQYIVNRAFDRIPL